ncbi:hypothetical protein KKB69_01140 [Patescibacteria group bacterium]|nr:hypothetical protein [Patescibacteria group bacterium]
MNSYPLLYIKIFAILLIALVLGFYFFHQAKGFLAGPQIKIDYPENGQTLANSFMSVRGVVTNTAVLLIDGQKVLADSFGNFRKDLLLAKGYNIIELSAKDRFNRETYKKLEVVNK